jgi:demethylmenaquinone methyltransferase/2-methoxy-6-polyprenyl-1,4-benzoquinol methylase
LKGFDHFNFLGPVYDLVFGRTKDHRMVELTELREHHRLLDVGGGTGRVTILFQGISSHLFIADSAFAMLKQAQEKDITCANAHSENLPYPDETFDRVILVDALHHVENQQRTLNEMWRVLKIGGKMIIEEPDIKNFLVKLVALGEKLVLMRSHFLKPSKIMEITSFNGNATQKIFTENGIVRIIITKEN